LNIKIPRIWKKGLDIKDLTGMLGFRTITNSEDMLQYRKIDVKADLLEYQKIKHVAGKNH